MNLLNQNKISTLLQFSYKANKLTFGESTIIAMMSNKVKVMVLANDIAPNQEKKYLNKAEFYKVKVVRYLSKSDLGSLFNKDNVACVGILDINMANQIIKLSLSKEGE